MNNSTAKAKPKMTVKNGIVYGDALSAQEKKRIVVQKKKDRKAKKVRKSAQQTIPYAVSYTHLDVYKRQHPTPVFMTGCWKCAPRSCSPGRTSADRPHKTSWIS